MDSAPQSPVAPETGSYTPPSPPSTLVPAAERVRLALSVAPEVRRAVTALAKLRKCEHADVLADQSINQVLAEFREMLALFVGG